MVEPVKMKCLRCGYEYTKSLSEDMEERTCPRCRSNSVRVLKTKASSD